MTSNVRQAPTGIKNLNMPTVKNLIAVASGKGGVGKSTVASNLALALAKTGAAVGLMDADVYGPSIPRMLGVQGRQPETDPLSKKMIPFEKHGIKFMSVGMLQQESDTALIWRGPMASKLVQQFLGGVEWGALDYLLIDLPPGHRRYPAHPDPVRPPGGGRPGDHPPGCGPAPSPKRACGCSNRCRFPLSASWKT